ncbi:MAG: hypothetical protein ABDH63_03900 [Candidatus Caldarchaeales archaeon]
MAEAGDEKVVAVIDCWRRTFSWRTLGGGVVRCFLIVTEGRVVEVETSHVANVPPDTRPVSRLNGSVAEHLLDQLFQTGVWWLFSESRRRDEQAETEATLGSIAGITLSRAIRFLNEVLGPRFGVKWTRISWTSELGTVECETVRRRGVHLEFTLRRGGERRRYAVAASDEERAAELERVVKSMFGVQ